MDEIVKAAMRKWPNVPSCFGWLGLSSRGDWYLRDEVAQQAGDFQSGIAATRGSKLEHVGMIEFIARNYLNDSEGNWFFQNGPQKVFVELAATPWIWRVDTPDVMTFHGRRARRTTDRCIVDVCGQIYIETDLGFGMVHSNDVLTVSQYIEQGIWVINEAQYHDLATKYGFCLSPKKRADPNQP